MKIILGWPPSFDEEDKKIENVITTYRGDIYLCDQTEIRDDAIEHEKKHLEQAGDDYDSWIEHCQTDTEFYISQEVEAYRTQLEFIEKTRGKEDMIKATFSFAKYLSSKAYGNVISYEEALKKLKQ